MSYNHDRRILDKAVDLARTSLHKRYKFGAILVKDGIPVTEGVNVDITHPMSPHPYQKLHAEVAAITRAMAKRINLAGCSLYVARVTKTRQFLSAAMPCIYCYGLIARLGIRRIIYTTYTSDFGTVVIK